MNQKPNLLFVVGPTACGKSDCAVEIAEKIAGKIADRLPKIPSPQIINTDSVQFFSGVNIGAAKPSANLLSRVRHHLIGHIPIGATYTAGQFREEALSVISEVSRQGVKTILAVGGSGFYVQALEKGMYDVPEIPIETRNGLEKESRAANGWMQLYLELQGRDPRAAEKIQANDRYRILRALEILRTHTGTLTEVRENFATNRPVEQPFAAYKIGVFLNRDTLRERVEVRTRGMLAQGLIDEVIALRLKLRSLAPDGSLDSWAPLKSVGYREVQAFLDGKLAQEGLAPAIVTSTMQLAKRQMTWFKRDASIKWFDSEKGFSAACEEALTLLK